MFDQLFEHPHALARHKTGPLFEQRLRYLGHLAEQGKTRRTLIGVAPYLLAVADYLRLADRPGEAISTVEIEEKATLWADRPPYVAHGLVNFLALQRPRAGRHITGLATQQLLCGAPLNRKIRVERSDELGGSWLGNPVPDG